MSGAYYEWQWNPNESMVKVKHLENQVGSKDSV